MEWLFTSKEIVNACHEVEVSLYGEGIENQRPDGCWESVISDETELKLFNRAICKAQAKKLVEWLSEHNQYFGHGKLFLESEEWQALRKEVGLE